MGGSGVEDADGEAGEWLLLEHAASARAVKAAAVTSKRRRTRAVRKSSPPTRSTRAARLIGCRARIIDPIFVSSDTRSRLIDELSSAHVPVTYDRYRHIAGPFYHGTKASLAIGDELVAGYGSNFQEGRVSNNIYFSALVETAAWGAELATALAGLEERGHIYVVEPLGPFEDDPNVTNKKFAGNPTQSYRTRHALRVVGELDDWPGHDPEVLSGMLERLAELRAQGLDVIED